MVRTYPLTIKQRAFLESIRWVDAVYPNGILVVDIDFNHFNMGVLGDQAHVSEFSDLVRNTFFSVCSKIDRTERMEWYGGETDEQIGETES